MGRKKRKGSQLEKPWCFYCDKQFNHEPILLKHQQENHYRCQICHKKAGGAQGLIKHYKEVHKETLTKIPNAIEGRDDVTKFNIHGSRGVPADAVRGDPYPPKKKATTAQNSPQAGAASGQMPPGYGAYNPMMMMMQGRMQAGTMGYPYGAYYNAQQYQYGAYGAYGYPQYPTPYYGAAANAAQRQMQVPRGMPPSPQQQAYTQPQQQQMQQQAYTAYSQPGSTPAYTTPIMHSATPARVPTMHSPAAQYATVQNTRAGFTNPTAGRPAAPGAVHSAVSAAFVATHAPAPAPALAAAPVTAGQAPIPAPANGAVSVPVQVSAPAPSPVVAPR